MVKSYLSCNDERKENTAEKGPFRGVQAHVNYGEVTMKRPKQSLNYKVF